MRTQLLLFDKLYFDFYKKLKSEEGKEIISITEGFLNFDKKKGTELENWELFKSTEKFEAFAEAKFREQEAIPKGESINHTGLMFEKDSFYLPENIGFTKDGLKLLYNPYEVASYDDGTIELVLSHSEIKKYLAKKPKS